MVISLTGVLAVVVIWLVTLYRRSRTNSRTLLEAATQSESLGEDESLEGPEELAFEKEQCIEKQVHEMEQRETVHEVVP